MRDRLLPSTAYCEHVQQGIHTVTIKGYTSIRHARVQLRDLNALVGANGSGKSNFIRVMELLGRIVDRELQYAVDRDGGASALLHQSTGTGRMSIGIEWQSMSYDAVLEATADNRLIFAAEEIKQPEPLLSLGLGKGHRESKLSERLKPPFVSDIVELLSGGRVFHFHDTSRNAAVKGPPSDCAQSVAASRCSQPRSRPLGNAPI